MDLPVSFSVDGQEVFSINEIRNLSLRSNKDCLVIGLYGGDNQWEIIQVLDSNDKPLNHLCRLVETCSQLMTEFVAGKNEQ
jgi:hypothetical protein